MRNIAILILICITSYVQAQDVTSARFEQKGSDVHITYYLSEDTDNVSIEFSDDGGLNFKHIYEVRGDVGKNITRGNKLIIWSVLDERDKLQGDKFVFRISAKPDTKPEPIRYIPSKPDPRPSYFSFNFGAKIGYGNSNFVGKGSKDFAISDGRSSITTTLFVDLKLAKRFALQLEAIYTRPFNVKYTSIVDDRSVNNKLVIDHFSVPILFKLDFGTKIRFSLYAGPQFGHSFSVKHSIDKFNWDSDWNFDWDSFFDDNDDELNDDIEVNDIDISCVFGMMFTLKFLDFDLRYNIGLTDISPNINAKTSTWQISVGYRF